MHLSIAAADAATTAASVTFLDLARPSAPIRRESRLHAVSFVLEGRFIKQSLWQRVKFNGSRRRGGAPRDHSRPFYNYFYVQETRPSVLGMFACFMLKRVRALLGTGGDAEIRTVAGISLLRIKSPDLRVGVRIRSLTLESVDGWYDVPMIPSTEIRQDGRQTCSMQETHRLDA